MKKTSFFTKSPSLMNLLENERDFLKRHPTADKNRLNALLTLEKLYAKQLTINSPGIDSLAALEERQRKFEDIRPEKRTGSQILEAAIRLSLIHEKQSALTKNNSEINAAWQKYRDAANIDRTFSGNNDQTPPPDEAKHGT